MHKARRRKNKFWSIKGRSRQRFKKEKEKKKKGNVKKRATVEVSAMNLPTNNKDLNITWAQSCKMLIYWNNLWHVSEFN